MNSIFSQFTNLYPVSKTLRFSLEPQGQTLENIKKWGILEEDRNKAENYKVVKGIFDNCHKTYIQTALNCLHLDLEPLAQAFYQYQKDKSKENKTAFDDIKKKSMSAVSKFLKAHDDFKQLEPKQLIADAKNKLSGKPFCAALIGQLSKEELQAVAGFDRFATYFKGYQETRNNIYAAEGATSIAHRLLEENFPKFLNNILLFSKLSDDLKAEWEEKLAPVLAGRPLAGLFEVKHFNQTLSQEGIAAYNLVLQGKPPEQGNVKLQGLNELCNLAYQNGTLERKVNFNILFKQILSERESASFLPDQFATDAELLSAVKRYTDELFSESVQRYFDDFKQTLSGGSFDSTGVFVDAKRLAALSALAFDQWDTLSLAIKQNGIKKAAAYPLASLQAAVPEQDLPAIVLQALEQAMREMTACKDKVLPELCREKITGYDNIKEYLDSIVKLEGLFKIFSVSDVYQKDPAFYGDFDAFYGILRNNIPLYNQVRNYATKKKYSEEKFSLNFGLGNFLNGWVDSKTEKSDAGTQYGGFLFRKENGHGFDYYLGICKNSKALREATNDEISEYERLYYYQLKSQSVFGSAYCGAQPYKEDKSELINIIRNIATKNHLGYFDEVDFEQTTPNQLINIFRKNVADETLFLQDPEFKRKNEEIISNLTKTLESLISKIPIIQDYINKPYTYCADLIADIDEICKYRSKKFIKISKAEFDALLTNSSKPLFLFRITNKDFDKKNTDGKKSMENLHTLYFKELLSGSEAFDLGTGAMFFRHASIENPFVHEKGEIVVNKMYKVGGVKHSMPGRCHLELTEYYNGKKSAAELSEDAKSYLPIAEYHKTQNRLVKDKRYTEDKFLFHLSMTLNPGTKLNPSEMNARVLDIVKDNPDVNIIGIDRGERNLIYVSLIDIHGNIKQQPKSFNIVNGVDYLQKLTTMAKQRDEARKNWKEIGKIKDTKEGYLSLVVHEIAQMMLENNAVLVMEDLNSSFKRGRFHIEQQVYQKFEKMLIDKLNYLADKTKPATDLGGISRAYQLTNKFESLQKLGKQSGFLFYVPARWTSKIDPKTGFVNLFTSRWFSTPQVMLETFKRIAYNQDEDCFEFEFNYRDFGLQDYTNHWVASTHGDQRIVYSKTEGKQSIDVTASIKHLLADHNIDFCAPNLHEQILAVAGADAAFAKQLVWLFKVTVSLRYGDESCDYILSPIKGADGRFFDSRTAAENEPQDGDANGAYHIALQGLRLLKNRIKNGKIEKDDGMQTYNWLEFAQKKAYRS